METTKSDKLIKRIIITIISACILTATFFSGYFTHQLSMSDELKTFKSVMDGIKKYYYQDISEKEMLEYALGAISHRFLDDYSYYMTAEEYMLSQAQKMGSRIGMGVSFGTDTDESGAEFVSAEIVRVLGNSPAEKAGLKSGQVIVGVGAGEDSITEVKNYDELIALVQNYAEGVKFTLKIKEGANDFFTVVSRELYTENYVYYSDDDKNFAFFGDNTQLTFEENVYLDAPIADFDSSTAYIKLVSFNGNAASQFGIAMEKFKNDGKKKLILDLRTNGGGYMNILQEIASHLVYKKDTKLTVAKAVFKDKSVQNFNIETSSYSSYGFENIAVLANDHTASASECLIGAMIDYGTLKNDFYDQSGTVNLIISDYVGSTGKTFGKGIMQSTFPNLENGSALKLTTATIHWPLSLRLIHGIGIEGEKVPTSSGKMHSAGVDNELIRAVEII